MNGELEIGEETSMTIMIMIMMKWNMAMGNLGLARGLVYSELKVSHWLSCFDVLFFKVTSWLGSDGAENLQKFSQLHWDNESQLRTQEQEFEKYYFIAMVSGA